MVVVDIANRVLLKCKADTNQSSLTLKSCILIRYDVGAWANWTRVADSC